MTLLRLGKLLQERRGDRGIRAIAEEIGISAPTLSRVERGKLPDLLTFQKICAWLRVDPNEFLDVPMGEVTKNKNVTTGVAVHFKADKLLSAKAANDLASLILVAQQEALGDS